MQVLMWVMVSEGFRVVGSLLRLYERSEHNVLQEGAG